MGKGTVRALQKYFPRPKLFALRAKSAFHQRKNEVGRMYQFLCIPDFILTNS